MSLRRKIILRLIVYVGLPLLAIGPLWAVSIHMPGKSFEGPLPALTAGEAALSANLRRHVTMLAGRIGERNYIKRHALDSAAEYIRTSFASLGLPISEQEFQAKDQLFHNIEVTVTGTSRPKEIVVVGGHYDSVLGTPGADDNASGTAAVIELARMFSTSRPDRTIRFVAFANEEPPFFFTEDMGSRHYARRARERGDDIVAMLSLETIGYYRDGQNTQHYPPILGSFYPGQGNFIGVVGNVSSRSLVHRVIGDFRDSTQFPSAGTAAWMRIPGISWSDQWSFWLEGYDGVMITDTAPFRNDGYHQPWDKPDSLNYDHMARVVNGVARVVRNLATAR